MASTPSSVGYICFSGTIPAALFLLLLFLVPETPRYLMLKGDETGARAVLAKLVTPEEGARELSEIRASLGEHHSGKLFSSELRRFHRDLAFRSSSTCLASTFVLYYATDIFKGMGMTTNASLLQTIIVGAVNLTFTVVVIFSPSIA